MFNRPINILCRGSLCLSMALCLLLRFFFFRLLRQKRFSNAKVSRQRQMCIREGAQFAVVRSAVLYQKPQSMVDCEYVWRHTVRWINFPWSTEPPVVDLSSAGTAVLDA